MQTFYWACGNLGRGGAMRSNYTHSEIDVRRANLSELGLFVSGSEGSPDGGAISHLETSGDPPLTRSALKLGFEDGGHRWPRMWHTSELREPAGKLLSKLRRTNVAGFTGTTGIQVA